MSTQHIDWYTFTAAEWRNFGDDDLYLFVTWPQDNGLCHKLAHATVHVPGATAAQVHHEKQEATVWHTQE